MLQVTAAGIRAGSSALGRPAVAPALAAGSLGDAPSDSVVSVPSVAVESPGDSSSSVPVSVFFSESPREPVVARESPGDSEARGDSDGRAGDAEGVACGDDDEPPEPVEPPVPPPLPLPPPPAPGVGVADCDPPPLEGGEVGDALGDADGDDAGDGDELGDVLGVGVAVGVVERKTGGATSGGTLEPAARSCCHDQPTEPPAGTVKLPAPYDEYVHDAVDPSAHQRPQ